MECNSDLVGSRSDLAGSSSVFIGGSSDFVGGSSDFIGGSSDLVGSSSDLVGGSSDLVGDRSDLVGSNSDLVGGNSDLVGGRTIRTIRTISRGITPKALIKFSDSFVNSKAPFVISFQHLVEFLLTRNNHDLYHKVRIRILLTI